MNEQEWRLKRLTASEKWRALVDTSDIRKRLADCAFFLHTFAGAGPRVDRVLFSLFLLLLPTPLSQLDSSLLVSSDAYIAHRQLHL